MRMVKMMVNIDWGKEDNYEDDFISWVRQMKNIFFVVV